MASETLELKRDAARWRWIDSHPDAVWGTESWDGIEEYYVSVGGDEYHGLTFGEAIDAAIEGLMK